MLCMRNAILFYQFPPSLSVCLSDGSIVSINKWKYRLVTLFDSLLRHQIFFLNPTTFTKFQYEPP